MNWTKSGGAPSQLLDDGMLVTKASVIATKMNEFFIKKVNDIKLGIHSLPNTFEKCHEIMRGRKIGLEMHYVLLFKVLKILKGLKASKSTSIDTLDSYSVKISAEVIAQPLHHIICLSIMQQKFPSEWKYSKVIPLHKKE